MRNAGMTAFHRLNVLVVDDNQDAADTLAMLIECWGFQVRVAYNGAAALESACQWHPDCVLLDIAMPLMDGYAVAERIRQEPDIRAITLIALTAYSDESHIRRVWEAGFNSHLVKPADLQEIQRILTMLSEVKQLTKQNGELLKEVKHELKEVKGELKELKEEVKEIKTELQDLRTHE